MSELKYVYEQASTSHEQLYPFFYSLILFSLLFLASIASERRRVHVVNQLSYSRVPTLGEPLEWRCNLRIVL